MLRHIVLFLCLSASCFAEIPIFVTPVKVTIADRTQVLGYSGDGDQLFTDGTLLGSAQNRRETTGVTIRVQSEVDPKFISVKARNKQLGRGSVARLESKKWLLVGSGYYLIEVTLYDPVNGIQEDSVEYTIGPSPDPGPLPPDPGPTPPTPDPSPVPIPDQGFRVLFVFETEDLPSMPPSQQAILSAKVIRDYLRTHCIKGADGKTVEARFFDQNTDVSNDSLVWQKAMVRPRTALPWIVISDGQKGYEGPLPQTVEGTLNLLRTYGGQ